MRAQVILSLFDGCATGWEALDDAGVPVERYMASEVDKWSSGVANFQHPGIENLGDVRLINPYHLPRPDAIIGGSPCQSFSMAGKRNGMSTKCKEEVSTLDRYLELANEGFEFDGQSYLFWEYIRLREALQPRYMLLENVRMTKKWQDLLSEAIGFDPIVINSNLVSAQNRHRLYWAGILQDDGTYAQASVTLPEDQGIMLRDVVHEFRNRDNVKTKSNTVRVGGRSSPLWSKQEWDNPYVRPDKIVGGCDPTPTFNVNPSGKGMNGAVRSVQNPKSATLTTNKGEGSKVLIDNLREYIVPFDKTLRILEKEVEKGKVGYFRKDSQANRVYFIHDKAITLCGEAGGGAAKMGQYLFGECKIVQKGRGKNSGGVKALDGKAPCMTSSAWEQNNKLLLGCISPDRVNKRQNGQRFNPGTKFYTLTTQDRHGILIEGYIRKLTPTECERLQTLPDGYTEYGFVNGTLVEISNSQRYRMLGNGWTKDVIAHIFKQLFFEETNDVI